LLTSENPEPQSVLETASTPPSVLNHHKVSERQRHDVVMFTKRVASIDLRIGLNLLGENGRMLLAQYLKTKSS
jgi:hypothetical protein